VAAARKERDSAKPKQPPARTLEARENQMISLAMDLVEKRILEGTASAQETTHFLKLGTVQAQMDKARQDAEIKLIHAKVEQMAAGDSRAQLAQAAIDAMRRYKGLDDDEGEIIG